MQLDQWIEPFHEQKHVANVGPDNNAKQVALDSRNQTGGLGIRLSLAVIMHKEMQRRLGNTSKLRECCTLQSW